MAIITYIQDGIETTYDVDYIEAFIRFNGRKIYKKYHPNVFESLVGIHPSSHHFDFRVIPIEGVKLIKI